MKQSKLISMIGALVVMISAVAFITACYQANDNKNKKENTTINNGGNGNTGTADNNGNTNTTDHSGDSLEIKPTGEAVPALAGTLWKQDTSDVTKIDFDKKRNIAAIFGFADAVYTIKDSKISFDLSSWIAIYKTITVDQHIQIQKAQTKKYITYLQEMITKETDDTKKNKLQSDLETQKKYLKDLDNPNAEMKKNFSEVVKGFNKRAEALESNVKFEGEFNTDKTELTIEKFPDYDREKEKVDVKKVVFKKQ